MLTSLNNQSTQILLSSAQKSGVLLKLGYLQCNPTEGLEVLEMLKSKFQKVY